VTDYSAVTGACMMVDRRRFTSIGGFDERFAVAWNDVDLCLRFREHGFRNVYLPHVRLYHFESKTRGADDTPAKVARAMTELRAMRERWPAYVERDPYYSPHLTVDAEDFGLRIER
jgi:GT2 family glycosyltransferase